jgi:hypothetical protein
MPENQHGVSGCEGAPVGLPEYPGLGHYLTRWNHVRPGFDPGIQSVPIDIEPYPT